MLPSSLAIKIDWDVGDAGLGYLCWTEKCNSRLLTDPLQSQCKGASVGEGGKLEQILSEQRRDWAWGWLSVSPGKQAQRLISEMFSFVVWTYLFFLRWKRGKGSLNSPFPVSVQFPGACRHQRGPSMQYFMSEQHLPSRRNGSNRTDVWTFYQISLWSWSSTVKHSAWTSPPSTCSLFWSLTCFNWLNPAHCSLITTSESCFFSFEVVYLNHFHFRTRKGTDFSEAAFNNLELK